MTDESYARFYTKARRFPKMIGRLNDGSRIPGGPYTLTQISVGGVVLFLMLMFRPVWGWGFVLAEIPFAVAISWVVMWTVGRLPTSQRNIVAAIFAGFSAAFSPSSGRYRGNTVTFRKPHTVRGRAVDLTPRAAVAEASHEEDVAVIASGTQVEQRLPKLERQPALTANLEPVVSSSAPMSAVERLLQQTGSKENR